MFCEQITVIYCVKIACSSNFLWKLFENRKRTFSGRETNPQPFGPEPGDFFPARFFGLIFGTAFNRKCGSIFGKDPRPIVASGFASWQVYHTPQEAASNYDEKSSTEGPHLSAKTSNRICAPCRVLLPIPAWLTDITTSRWERSVMVSTTKACYSLLAAAVLSNHNLTF